MERVDSLDAPTPVDVEDVEIWADYGDTFWWEGSAYRSAGLLVSGFDPYGLTKDDPGGEDARPVHDGVPDWVPADWRPHG